MSQLFLVYTPFSYRTTPSEQALFLLLITVSKSMALHPTITSLFFCAGVGKSSPVHFDVGSFILTNDISTGTTVHLGILFQLMNSLYSRFMAFQHIATANFLIFEKLCLAFSALNGQHVNNSLKIAAG